MSNKTSVSRIFVLWAIGGLIGCVFLNLLWRFGPYLNISERKLAIALLEENPSYELFWEMGISVLSICIYVFTVCAGFTELGKILSEGFCFVIGVWWGAFLTECILVKGLRFILELGKLLFPESIFYFAAYICCVIWVDNMSTSAYKKRKHTGRSTGKYGKILAISILFFVIWCLNLFYVNRK